MSYAFRLTKTGGPEVLEWQPVDVGRPGSGQVALRHTAVTLNYIDTLHRRGVYPLPLPNGLGVSAAGVVTEVGQGVAGLRPGDRVAYAWISPGAYAEERIVPADRIVKIPAEISDQQAAAIMMQGMTARFLIRRTYKVKAGDTILVHAAAGGVGLFMCQWAKHLGATVIGTVSSTEKAQFVKQHGCDYPIVYTSENFVDRVVDITGGRKLPVVYDSVGKDTFDKSFDCLQPFGLMVLYGQSSGLIGPIDTSFLAAKGSLYFTRPTIWAHVARHEDLVASANEVFDVVKNGHVKVALARTYPLKEAGRAHNDLVERKISGSVVFTL